MGAALLLTVVATASAAAPIDSIGQVLELSREAAAQGLPVRLEGTVTFADPVSRSFFIEDRGEAISMWYPDAGFPLHQGDRLRIEAVTGAGDFAPKVEIDGARVERLEEGVRVPTSEPTLGDLVSGRLDCRSVLVRGVVRDQAVADGTLELRLLTLLGPTRLLFAAGAAPVPMGTLVGAEVEVRATVGIDLNARRQRTGVRLYAQRLDELRVLQPPLSESALPRLPIAELLRYHA